MIDSAANAGFTHGKIQGLYSYELTQREDFEDASTASFRPYEKEFARLNKLDLSPEDEEWFVSACADSGITAMITVFTHHGVERARSAGFKSVKIASYDCSSLPIIRKIADFADEIIVSTGATSWQEIATTAMYLETLKDLGKSVGLLHARTVYPATPEVTGLGRMMAMKAFGLPVGFSDHSRPQDDNLLASRFALLLGAEIIERHYTVLEKSETKDGPVSINEHEAKKLSSFAHMSYVKKVNSILGELNLLGEYIDIENLEPLELELQNLKYYRGRVISVISGKSVPSWETSPFD